MRIEWQPDDIIPGRIVGKPDRIERWMIGYVVVSPQKGKAFCLVSLSDGMVQQARGAEELAADLNEAGELPIEFFSDPIKLGPQMGGKARAASLSPQRRSEIATGAAKTRWRLKREREAAGEPPPPKDDGGVRWV